jgi:hypothetical protein
MFNLKLKDNLHISHKGEVWSYDTRVAIIKNGVVQELGKFTRTTSKHVSFVSTSTGLSQEFKPVEGGIHFQEKYCYGAKCSPLSNTLSPKTSKAVIRNGALANEDILWSNLFDILIHSKEYPKKDVSEIRVRVLRDKKMEHLQLEAFLQKYAKVQGIMDFI